MEEDELNALWGFQEVQEADGFIGMTVPGTYDPHEHTRIHILDLCLKGFVNDFEMDDDEDFAKFMQRVSTLTDYVLGNGTATTIDT